jgi:ABC-type glutathione transport system ATPase component
MTETINLEKTPEFQNLLSENSTCSQSFIIKGVHLHKAYNFKKFFFSKPSTCVILDNVNINIEKGKIYGLLGPSGIRMFNMFFDNLIFICFFI